MQITAVSYKIHLHYLPKDYQLDFKQFKTVTDSFNPTLDESKLITPHQ